MNTFRKCMQVFKANSCLAMQRSIDYVKFKFNLQQGMFGQ